MFFNENEVYQMVKLRQEETEKKARNAWKLQGLEQETFFQKVVRNWKNGPKSMVVQPNGGCACEC